jgi:GWxTD domain-containing protein
LISSSLAILSTAQDDRVAAPLVPASYQKWLEDVSYIITDEERTDFTKLSSDQQRDRFIDDFWKGCNPNPGSPKNIFKEEHYRRLAYVNEHFAAGVPGYKTDRGRIYIQFGPADRIEQHFPQRAHTMSAISSALDRSPTTGNSGIMNISKASARTSRSGSWTPGAVADTRYRSLKPI